MSSGGDRRFHVFLSHNSTDKPAVEHLARKLMAAGIQPWFDKWQLEIGMPWQQALEYALTICPACAVFIGPSGFSRWQTQEMNAAIGQQVRQSKGSFRVIPILLPGARREERSKLPLFLQANTWVEFSGSLDDENAFHRLLCGIRGEEPGSSASDPLPPQGEPYRGLEHFGLEHGRFFFGREALLGWLLNVLKAPDGASENRFLGLVGPVGSGKSSLARAGLLTAIERGDLPGSTDWRIVICTPGADPVENLAIALANSALGEKTPAAIRNQIRELRANERTLHLATRLSLSEFSPTRRVVVLVDQFEEVFTQCKDEALRLALIDNLMTAAVDPEGQAIVVLTLRGDFYGECSAYPQLAAALSDHQILVGPMQDAELRRAIERPAALVGAEFEHGLVDALLDEMRDQPSALPLLQYTLLELWQHREGKLLTHAAYQSIGKIGGALERRAEEVYLQFSEPERLVLRRILLRLVQSTADGKVIRRRVRLGDLMPAAGDTEMVERVVEKLTKSPVRLITKTSGQIGVRIGVGPESVKASRLRQNIDIVHEALVRSWKRLEQWLEQDQEFQLWQKRLTTSLEEWEQIGRHPDALLRGALLEEAKHWLELRSNDLNRDEQDFISAGITRQQEQLEVELTRRKQLQEAQERRFQAETARAELQARSAGTLRKLVSVLSLLFVAAATSAMFAWHEVNVANSARALSTSLDLAAASADNIRDPDLALILAMHAVTNSDTPEAEHSLHQAIQTMKGARFAAPGQAYIVESMAFSPQLRLLATANSDSSVVLWNIEKGAQPGQYIKIGAGVESMAFLPQGRQGLAVATSKGTIQIIDFAGKKLLPDIPVSAREVKSVAFSPGGDTLAIGTQDSSAAAAIQAYPDGLLRRLSGHTGPVRVVKFTPTDGKYLMTASVDGTIVGWDPRSGVRVFTLGDLGGPPLLSLAVSPRLNIVAAGDASGFIRLWELPAGRLLQKRQHSHLKKVQGLAFSDDGRTLASASQDGTVKLWDFSSDDIIERAAVSCGKPAAAPEPVDREGCTALVFIDGHTLVAAGRNGEVRQYEIDIGRLLAQATGMIDMSQIGPDTTSACKKYLRKRSCELPGPEVIAKQ